MIPERSDDARLIDAVGQGNERALEAIYKLHGGAVMAVANRVLRDTARAEDVVQDVFVTLWNNPGGFNEKKGSLKTYLTTIAHRRAVDIVRSEVARSRREETMELPQAPDIDDEVWSRALSVEVREAVSQLSDGEREAISLAYFGGLTYLEVAAALDEPEGTVKSRIRSGMKKLRGPLGGVAP